jgi:hypothetical protein
MNPLDGEADDFSKMLGLCIGAALVRFVGSSTEGGKERYVWDPEGLVVGFDIGRRDGGAEGRLVDGRGVGSEGGLLWLAMGRIVGDRKGGLRGIVVVVEGMVLGFIDFEDWTDSDGLENGDNDGLESIGTLTKSSLNSSRSMVPSPFLSSSLNKKAGSLFSSESDGDDVLGTFASDRQCTPRWRNMANPISAAVQVAAMLQTVVNLLQTSLFTQKL